MNERGRKLFQISRIQQLTSTQIIMFADFKLITIKCSLIRQTFRASSDLSLSSGLLDEL